MSNPYSMPQAQLTERVGDDTYMPKLFSLEGRIGRVRYLGYGFAIGMLMIPLMFVMTLLGGLGGAFGGMGGMVLGYVIYIAATFVLARRRLNDLGKSGWLSLLLLVPLVNIGVGLWMLFGEGDQGSNEYGPAPAPNTTGVIILAWSIPVVTVLFGILAAISIPAYQQYLNKSQAAQMQDSQ